jgi:hypothetical protein
MNIKGYRLRITMRVFIFLMRAQASSVRTSFLSYFTFFFLFAPRAKRKKNVK